MMLLAVFRSRAHSLDYARRLTSYGVAASTMPTPKEARIGCGICVKNCPNDAIKVENNLARIDYDICWDCGICAEKCPKKIIV